MDSTQQEIRDRARLQTYYKRYRPHYESALRKMVRRIRGRMVPGAWNATLKSRVKTFESYYAKLLRVYIPEAPTEGRLSDMLGIRLICPFLSDVEQVARDLRTHFDVVEEERKGDDRSFREFGYDSIHLSLQLPDDALPEQLPGTLPLCEVQIRTTLQEAWAEIEHELIYKTDLVLPDESVRRKLASLNATLTLSDAIFQELRDYQIEQKRSRESRHQRLQNKAEVVQRGDLPLAFEDVPALEGLTEENCPLSLQIEKTLVEALRAHSEGELDRAVRLYGKVLRLEPESQVRSVVLNHRGMALFLLNDLEFSLEDFTAALVCNPDNHRAYYNRSLVLCSYKRYHDALDDLKRSLELNPLHVESWYSQARILFEMRKCTEAQTACNAALDLEPAFEKARALLMQIQEKIAAQ